MKSEGENFSGGKITWEERDQLERLWTDERLSPQHEKLRVFVREERFEILRLSGGQRDPAALSLATQQHIATLRTVHHQSEMHDQMREMHNEIWYCGQRGDFDTRRITKEWVERHGSNWRNWRIKEYLFVAERCADEVADIINSMS